MYFSSNKQTYLKSRSSYTDYRNDQTRRDSVCRTLDILDRWTNWTMFHRFILTKIMIPIAKRNSLI